MRIIKSILVLFIYIFILVIIVGCDLSLNHNEDGKNEEDTNVLTVDSNLEEPLKEFSKVILAACDPWPPYIDPDNPTGGLSMELIRAAFKEEGYEVCLEIVPWIRAVEGVKIAKYDILPDVWFTLEREEYLLFGDSYAVNELRFIKLKGDSFEFDDMNSLKGKTVGVVNGYGYGDAFLNESDFIREPSDDILQNIEKLISNRIDLTIEDRIVATARILKKDPSLLEKIEFTENSLGESPMYIAVGRENPRSKEIIEAYNKGLKTIKENGVFNEIMNKYNAID